MPAKIVLTFVAAILAVVFGLLILQLCGISLWPPRGR